MWSLIHAGLNSKKTCPNGMKYPIAWIWVNCSDPPKIICPDKHVSTTGIDGCGNVDITVASSITL